MPINFESGFHGELRGPPLAQSSCGDLIGTSLQDLILPFDYAPGSTRIGGGELS
jgi:hypothetical protein